MFEAFEAKVIRIGIVGMGTVGQGVLDVLQMNQAIIQRRLGGAAKLQITRIGSRKTAEMLDLKHKFPGQSIQIHTDVMEVARASDVDILLELIGGVEIAKDVVLMALQNGKQVVTANKALIATHGEALFAEARDQKVQLLCESSVAGGIPIMKALREGLAANEINWLAGIINGTCNFILTAMAEEGKDFAPTLAEAQKLGYAEADPSFDIHGIDAAHKPCIMASTAFGMPLNFDALSIQGIENLNIEDIEHAKTLGYVVKHLGIAKKTPSGLDLRVHPTLIPKESALASVNGVMNGVLVNANAVGSTLYSGPGAGGLPTASAVVADLVEIARSLAYSPAGFNEKAAVPALGFSDIQPIELAKASASQSSFYLRFTLEDQLGALASIAKTLTEHGISIEALLQKEPRVEKGKEIATLIILTHEVAVASMDNALKALKSVDYLESEIHLLRLERFA